MDNKNKTALLSLALVAFGTVSTINTKPAQASMSDAVKFVNDNWGSIVSNLWSPWNKQVFMLSHSSQEVESTKKQYVSRAEGVLTDRCINKVADQYYTGWRNNAVKTAYRWTIAMRIENGVGNCYQRMPNQKADDFMRKRGY